MSEVHFIFLKQIKFIISIPLEVWISECGMIMNLQYHLKTIRKTVAYDEVCLSASIWFGHTQVGRFWDCSDTGKPIFSFDDVRAQQEFAHYIQEWWANSEHVALCNLYSRELVDKNLAHDFPMNTKMRCWISLKVGPMDTNSIWKWPSREAKQVLHSFRRSAQIVNR